MQIKLSGERKIIKKQPEWVVFLLKRYNAVVDIYNILKGVLLCQNFVKHAECH